MFTDPWWNLVGVFDDLFAREGIEAEFDVYLRVSRVSSRKDCVIELRLIDPSTLQPAAVVEQMTRGDLNGVVTLARTFNFSFEAEGMYHIEVLMDGTLLDLVLMRVIFLE